jgi:hypothetical protein
MSALCSHGSADVLRGAPFDLITVSAAQSSATRGGLAGSFRDIVLIALAWVIFVGVILHPGVQIVGIVTCALALLIGGARAATNRAEI